LDCPTELRRLRSESAPPMDDDELRRDPVYRAGYARGFRNALDDAIEIADEEHGE